MVAIIQAANLDLNVLEEKFNFQLATDDSFFAEWQSESPETTDSEKQTLERVANNYLNLIKFRPMLEETVKMVVLSPLLDLAGLYQRPFRIATEQSTEIVLEDKDEVVKGRMDVLVLKKQLWVLVIESKMAGVSLEYGIPQVLFYMLSSSTPCYGFVTNGSNFIFAKLIKAESPVYALSDEFTLRRAGDLDEVLGVLKNLASCL